MVIYDSVLLYNKRWLQSSIPMHHGYVFFQISLLSERTLADFARIRSRIDMHTVVILDVACLFENLVTTLVFTSEIILVFM